MSMGMKIYIGLGLFYLALIIIMGETGLAQLESQYSTPLVQINGTNEDSLLVDSDTSLNYYEQIYFQTEPDFIDGALYAFSVLPLWLTILINIIPALLLSVALIYLIRGVG